MANGNKEKSNADKAREPALETERSAYEPGKNQSPPQAGTRTTPTTGDHSKDPNLQTAGAKPDDDAVNQASNQLESDYDRASGKPRKLSKEGFPKYKDKNKYASGDERKDLKKYKVMQDRAIIRGEMYSTGGEIELTKEEYKAHQERGVALQDVEAEEKRQKRRESGESDPDHEPVVVGPSIDPDSDDQPTAA